MSNVIPYQRWSSNRCYLFSSRVGRRIWQSRIHFFNHQSSSNTIFSTFPYRSLSISRFLTFMALLNCHLIINHLNLFEFRALFNIFSAFINTRANKNKFCESKYFFLNWESYKIEEENRILRNKRKEEEIYCKNEFGEGERIEIKLMLSRKNNKKKIFMLGSINLSSLFAFFARGQ